MELHPHELPRYLASFRAELGQRQPPPRSWVSEIGAATRQVVTQFQLGRLETQPYLDYLQSQQAIFKQALERVSRLEHAAAASAAAALRDLASTLEQLAEARPSKQDLKRALAGYTQGLERLRVASQVEDQLLWLQQFDQVKGEQ